MADERPSFWQDLVWRLEVVGYDLLLGVLRLFPVDAVSGFGGRVLQLLGPLTSTHKVARKNLQIAFPQKDPDWIEQTLKAQWDNVGRAFIETPFLDRIMADPSRVELVNGERLQEIIKTGEAVVFVSGHLSNWEVMPAVIVQQGVNCLITYRAINNPYIDKRVKDARFRYGVRLFSPKAASAMRSIIEGLRKGVSVALMADQRFDEGVSLPFFGLPADTNPGPARMALHTGAKLQTMSVERLKGARFRVTVQAPMRVEDTGDRLGDVNAGLAQINGFLEAQIRARPAEYFWVHRRWPKPTYKEAPA